MAVAHRTGHGVIGGQLGGLELRHRQHARVEDRIRQAKATGLRNLPCHRSDANMAWLEIILAATDLVAWSKLIGFPEHLDLATCEIDTFRCPVSDRTVASVTSVQYRSNTRR
jgi:Transposase DDE domain group 1